MKAKERTSKLAVSFGIRLGIEIMVLFTILAFLATYEVQKQLEKNFIQSTTQTLEAHASGVTYRNSKFMQQMRMYTTADVVTEKRPTEEIVEWLTAHEKIRGGDFKYIMYCDVEDGKGYKDNGEVVDVTGMEFYRTTLDSNLNQYYSEPVGSSYEDAVYFVTRSMRDKDKNIYGIWVGAISLPKLAEAINRIQIGEKGFAMLLDKSGNVMAFNNPDLVMKNNFAEAQGEGYEEISTIAKKMIAKESGYGWVHITGGKTLMVYMPIGSTNWSMALSVSEDEVFAAANTLMEVLLLLVVIIAVILTGTATISIIRSLKPLAAVNKNIAQIATGDADLTQRMEVIVNNEIGAVTRGFNAFVEKLHSIMFDVKQSKKNLQVAGDDLNASIEDTAGSISEILNNINRVTDQITAQAASVDETAGAVNEIASNIESLERMIEKQSMGVSQASSAVEEMIGNISSVNQSVEKMASSFEILENQTKAGNQKQQQMNSRIEEIESQSEMLQEANQAIAAIAEQTNLLAMNAAIEAAHAGDAGKGFSVVADEIRKLSETSSEQSKTIGQQLNQIKEAITLVVSASVETSATFNAVTENIHQTDELVKQIKAAMEEQTQGSRQISEALHEMSDSTAEVRTASKEMSAGNQAILDEVRHLKDATTDIKASMGEMGDSARKIDETGTALTGISEKMRDSITEIGSQIDTFQV